MSRERARRRAEREAAAAEERARRAAAARRRRRRQAVAAWLSAPLRRGGEPRSALARARARQNGVLLAVLACGHVVLWLLQPSWMIRGAALVLTVAAWPLLLVLAFDRRGGR